MKTILTLLLFFLAFNAMATHNRAGEIHIEQIGELTIRATIITYTKASSIPADRDSLEICWGDGTCENVARANGGGNGEILPNDIKYNLYISEHTYSGRATYLISMNDPFRNGGILNVNYPNSNNVQLHIQTTFTFLSNQFQGWNTTPYLLQPPIDIGCTGKIFIHNPNAYDVDGDSLAYRLIVPLQDINTPVPLYEFPNEIIPGPFNQISLNQVTGTFLWDSPQLEGEYNIALIIISYRDGIAIDTTIRDMQIAIEECDNDPPVIELEEEICVVAGELISFDVVATDPNPGQEVKMNAYGGPFELDISPAGFTGASGYQTPPVTGTFTWQTTCEHISDQYYFVVFKAVDDYFDTTGLATLKTVRIKVVGPPPEEVMATPGMGEIAISWELPYACEAAADDYFYSFSVWRRIGSNPFPPDTCVTGLAGRGYTRIKFDTTNTIVNGRYHFLDTDVERGRTYCYRVLAHFAKRTAAGNPYNLVESLPSEEICVQLSRDVPLIINVSVLETDVAAGEIEVRWTKPDATDLDTLQHPPPYRYQLLRGTGLVAGDLQPVPGADFISPTYWQANDTMFIDTGLNTVENPYIYAVAFYTGGASEVHAEATPASSVFLSVASTDNTNILSWDQETPWTNFLYTVYRYNDLTAQFDSIGFSTGAGYTDTGLENGLEYCYYVKSAGTYGITGLPAPLFNLSQEVCGIPLDTVPPCPPMLTVANPCELATPGTPAEAFFNTLNWTNPINTCPETDDVVTYNIYFAPVEGGDFTLIETVTFSLDTIYEHQSDLGIAGCYAITALDTLGNESDFSNIFCVDNCPFYALPNAFTPNADNQNDLFIPYAYRFIDHIEFQVFNRWGVLVFETTDPSINWNGRNFEDKELAEGTYFYSCRVFEIRVNGVVPAPEILSGYIELIR